MNQDRCDLHIHSDHSDGTFSPKDLIAEAERVGLSAIALTDHNTVTGLPSFLAAADKSHVEGIAGIEVSADYDGKELHILGLFLDEEYYDELVEFLRPMAENKERSNVALIQALADGGYDITYEEVTAESGEAQFNRSHVAQVLTEKGYTSSIKEAFETVLSKKAGFYKQPERPSALDVIAFLKSIGTAVVLAHPFLSLTEEELRAFLPSAIAAGLDGMEAIYSGYSEETTALARSIAREFGICESGGSDFHGGRKPDISMGSGKGNLAVPCDLMNLLKERSKRK